MALSPRDKFCRDTVLSLWTSELAEQLPGHPRQFDADNPLGSHGASRLYWLLSPGGYIRLDVYSPDPELGYVVFLLPMGKDLVEIHASGGDMQPVIEAFQQVVDGLPADKHLASAAEAAGKRKDGLDERQLITFGQMLHEKRTGSPLPASRRGRPKKRNRVTT